MVASGNRVSALGGSTIAPAPAPGPSTGELTTTTAKPVPARPTGPPRAPARPPRPPRLPVNGQPPGTADRDGSVGSNGARPQPASVRRVGRGRRTGTPVIFGSFAFLAVAVVGFSAGWIHGDLLLDGPGVAMHVGLALDHWRDGGVPYWMPEIWAGSPFWALAPSFPIFVLLPLASVVGAENAVKLASVAAQVAGGWGTLVLARSLWGRRTFPPLLAGLAYALHPTFISHTALFGHETSAWVIGATPWLAWSFRHALRGSGSAYVALSGLLGAFVVLQQGEHAYSLAILCACLMAVELARARFAGPGPSSAGAVTLRAGVAALIGVGAVAYWLFPFAALSKSFVLTPADSVRAELVTGIGGSLGRHPEAWVTRSPGFEGTVDFSRLTGSFVRLDGIMSGSFYLGWVCLALTVVTVILLSRRHHGSHHNDAHLSAILFAGVIALWLSTGGVPLASSGLARAGAFIPFALAGVLAGALVGGFLRQLHLGRAAVILGTATAVVLVTLPYAAPFLTLQKVIPLLDSIRFPRFYPVAMLGLALAAAYPLTLLEDWAARRQPQLSRWLSAALAMVVAGVFLVDVAPYRSYYRLRQPGTTATYREKLRALGAESNHFRLATQAFGDPSRVASLVEEGRLVSIGWPHPVAGKNLWTVTGKALVGPPLGYRQAALGLSSTNAVIEEHQSETGPHTEVLDDIQVERNPLALPMVRAYEQVAVVPDADLAAGLAVALSQRHIGVVTGGRSQAGVLGDATGPVVGASDACDELTVTPAEAGGPEMAGEIGAACALNQWVNTNTKGRLTPADQRPGAMFVSQVAGLRGVSVLLDREPGQAEIVLREVLGDGRSLGREVVRTRASGTDTNNMAAFVFDAIADSAGKRYVFELSCLHCPPDRVPKMANFEATDRPGNLVVGGVRQRKRLATFSLIYDRLAPHAPATTSLEGFRLGPGRWRVTASGSRPALLVVADAWFPGWKARLDGKSVPVLKADGAFLGVAVPAGEHELILEYDKPVAATVGRAVTTLTVAASALFFAAPLWHRARRRRIRHVRSPRE